MPKFFYWLLDRQSAVLDILGNVHKLNFLEQLKTIKAIV